MPKKPDFNNIGWCEYMCSEKEGQNGTNSTDGSEDSDEEESDEEPAEASEIESEDEDDQFAECIPVDISTHVYNGKAHASLFSQIASKSQASTSFMNTNSGISSSHHDSA